MVVIMGARVWSRSPVPGASVPIRIDRDREIQTSSNQGRGRSTSIKVIDHGTESESSTKSTHASLGRPHTPSRPNDSSGVNSHWKDYGF